MSTQIILLERVEKLGNLGDVVSVKPGYARNYLLPQKKALRASKENMAYFEAQKKQIEAENEKQKDAAKTRAKKIEGKVIALIRQASETGQLYGSVAARDISEAVREETGENVTRGMININQNFKTLGLFPLDITLHPEVKVDVTVNIARSMDEAKIQEKSGEAVVSDDSQQAAPITDAPAEETEETSEAEVTSAEETASESDTNDKTEAA